VIRERAMSSSDQDNKQRNREIAQNEAERQTVGDIRVSGWAIAFAIIIGVIAVGVVWVWLKR
jgi:Flp pilus assembly protein TadB